jgi:hypothetical protein
MAPNNSGNMIFKADLTVLFNGLFQKIGGFVWENQGWSKAFCCIETHNRISDQN